MSRPAGRPKAICTWGGKSDVEINGKKIHVRVRILVYPSNSVLNLSLEVGTRITLTKDPYVALEFVESRRFHMMEPFEGYESLFDLPITLSLVALRNTINSSDMRIHLVYDLIRNKELKSSVSATNIR